MTKKKEQTEVQKFLEENLSNDTSNGNYKKVSLSTEDDLVFEGQLFPRKSVIATMGGALPEYEWAHLHEIMLYCLGAIPNKDYTYIDLLTLATSNLSRGITKCNHVYFDIKLYLAANQKKYVDNKRRLDKS